MKTSADYLDALQRRFKVESDYALQKHTGWRNQQISRYRTLKNAFDDATAEKVAAWLNVPLEEILVHMAAQRASSDAVKRAWLKVAGAVVVVVLGVQLALQPMMDRPLNDREIWRNEESTDLCIIGTTALGAALGILLALVGTRRHPFRPARLRPLT